jgi:hypothetical protein
MYLSVCVCVCVCVCVIPNNVWNNRNFFKKFGMNIMPLGGIPTEYRLVP